MRIALLAVVLGACQAPAITIAGDASLDVAVTDAPAADGADTRICEKVKGVDGGICGGNDEDHDCVPDECDDCPNVPQDPIKVSRGAATSGSACTHPPSASATFERATKRLVFDAFTTVDPRWMDWGPPLAIAAEELAIHDGAAHLGATAGSERYAALRAGAGSSDVVALAWLRFPGGNGAGGIALRLQKAPASGYVCLVLGDWIELRYRMCDAGGACGMVPFRKPSGENVRLMFPPDIDPIYPLVVRFAAQTTATGVHLECQIFRAPKDARDVALTLRLLDSGAHTLSHAVTAPIYPSGEVGLYTGNAPLVVDSLDVLVP